MEKCFDRFSGLIYALCKFTLLLIKPFYRPWIQVLNKYCLLLLKFWIKSRKSPICWRISLKTPRPRANLKVSPILLLVICQVKNKTHISNIYIQSSILTHILLYKVFNILFKIETSRKKFKNDPKMSKNTT